MLGREYELDGLVAKGDKVGRKIGYPTINLEPENELHPADGVYVTQIHIRSFGRRFDCVTNIGRRPTVYEEFDTTIETFVLDFSANVYGEKVRLFFFDRLREERKFPSVTDLVGADRPRYRGDARSISRGHELPAIPRRNKMEVR